MLLIGCLIIVGLVASFPSFERSYALANFQLVDQNRNSASPSSFQGQWLLVFFGFSHCPHVCPSELNRLAGTLRELDKAAGTETITPIFITVDPVRDTPEVLKLYLANFDERFIGLTGSDMEIANATAAFNAYRKARAPATDREDYLVDHSSVSYIVNPTGVVVGHLPYGQSAADRANKIRRLVRASESR